MIVKFLIRRDTAADWVSTNPVLGEGEPGLETDTRKVKYGDGVTAWNSLAYTAVPIAWGDITGSLASQSDLSTALGAKAPLASPALTGTPTAPTAGGGTNTTQIATTAFVRAEVAALVASAPGALDTLDELAAALGDDPNFATSVATSLGLKAPLASPTFTGTPAAPTASGGTNTTQIATTAFVTSALTAKAPLASPNFTGTVDMAGASPFGWGIGTSGFDVSGLGTNSWAITARSGGSWLNLQNAHFINANGRIGIQTATSTDPTALLDIGVAGSTTLAPIKMKTAGAALLTTPQAGAFETDGTDLYWTNNAGTRKKVTIV